MSTKEDVTATASSYMASHGILMASRHCSVPHTYEPAPFSLHPTPFPQRAFDSAYSMSYNRVVHQIAQSYVSWMKDAIETAAKGDADFTGKLVALADEVMESVAAGSKAQNMVLGILRSDYMLHGGGGDGGSDNADDKSTSSFHTAIPLQVELNTIASSFGCLSSKITAMHQSLETLPYHKKVASTTFSGNGHVPENKAADNVAAGLAAACNEYIRQRGDQIDTNDTIESVVVMVVEKGDSNSCDQRELEFKLHRDHQIRLVRRTLVELSTTGRYNTNASLFQGKELLLPDGDDTVAAAVVYFRAGYAPEHYSSDVEWKGRAVAEHSAAIKSPDVFYHLVGAKKIQQKLAAPGVLRQFCISDAEETLLQSSFAGLYSLGEGDDSEIVKEALGNPHAFVLKPQREGGGNNLYDDELVQALSAMSYAERGAFILMQKILPPSTHGVLIRGGEIVYEGNTVCEVGVFSVSLREYSSDNNEGKVLMDKVGGHILRSKSVTTDEGGVAAGYAFLSSPRLV